MPLNIVVDANVVIKAYIPETLSDGAESLFIKVEKTETSLSAPDLIYPEIGNILWKRQKLKDLTVSEIEEISREILNLPLKIIPSKSILQLAIDIGIKYGITVCDAVYVSVAKIYETKLVTADEKFVDKLSKTPLSKNIEWLGEYMNYGG
jgi:predicted nucleic acid-binding protein